MKPLNLRQLQFKDLPNETLYKKRTLTHFVEIYELICLKLLIPLFNIYNKI